MPAGAVTANTRWQARHSVVATLLSALALTWALAALWPSGGLAAWPGMTLGLIGTAASWRPGPLALRCMGSILGAVAAALAAAQIVALWSVAEILTLSHM